MYLKTLKDLQLENGYICWYWYYHDRKTQGHIQLEFQRFFVSKTDVTKSCNIC